MRQAKFRVRLIGMCSFIACCAVGGCQVLGPSAIDRGRQQYNDIIQSTAMTQLLSNIVRVADNEPTLFVDVTEVDATQSFGGSLSAAATNIGARPGTSGGTLSGQVGSAAGGVQYNESPTIRYQPLLGQALVAQLVTPLDVSQFPALLNSGWPPSALFDMATQNIVPDHDEFYPALNTIDELYHLDGLEFAVSQSELTRDKSVTPSADVTLGKSLGTITIQMSGSGAQSVKGDSLDFYFPPFHTHGTDAGDQADEMRRLRLWARLLAIYAGTQPSSEIVDSPTDCKGLFQLKDINSVDERRSRLEDFSQNIAKIFDQVRAGKKSLTADQVLNEFRKCLRQYIELRSVPVKFSISSVADVTPPGGHDNARNGKVQSPADTEAPRLAQIEQELTTHAPLLRAKSALGILKFATERPSPRIEFVTRAEFEQITSPKEPWNQDTDNLDYYTLLPTDEDSIACPKGRRTAGCCPELERKTTGCDNPVGGDDKHAQDIRNRIGKWISTLDGKCFAYEFENSRYCGQPLFSNSLAPNFFSDDFVELNNALGSLRRYILVIAEDHKPSRPTYVEFPSDDGKWYYIDATDVLSQRNFHLLLLFMTMMAVPPQSAPLTPSISVGGSGG